MAVSKYKTKKGIRYLAEVWVDGERVATKAGFLTRLEAHQWEKDTLKQTSASMPNDLALSDIATLYLLDIENRLKKNTISYKRSTFRKFISFIGKDTPFTDITRQDIKSFLDSTAASATPKTANNYKKELSVLWSWSQDEGHVTSNPVKKIQPFPVTRHIRYIPPKEHIQKTLQHASQFERDFILALLHTAGRFSELRELAWEDVDLDRGILRLWTSKRKGGNRESRAIAISPTLRDILERLSGERTGGEIYVFTNPVTGNGYTRQSREMKYMFHRVCSKAEVPLFTAHCLRHFVATHFDDPRRAQKILGHENLKTTEIYLHELGVDMGAASVFEAITNGITNDDLNTEEKDNKNGATFLQ